MSYIHTLPEQVRIDAALMQYTARQQGIVDYRIRPVFTNGLYHYQSEVERCNECGQPAFNVELLVVHYRSILHIAEMYQIPQQALEEQINSRRHNAIQHIIKAYRYKTGRMLSSFIPLEPVIRFVGDDLRYQIHKLRLPQLEELIDILQLHVPDYYEQTKAFWAMQLLRAQ